jgi:hypothetical protein
LNIDMSQHFHALARGVIDVPSLGFYVAVIIISLVANTLILGLRRHH